MVTIALLMVLSFDTILMLLSDVQGIAQFKIITFWFSGQGTVFSRY